MDVKVPFETQRAVDESASRNEEKYRDLAAELRADIFTFPVGALGSWTARAERLTTRTFRLSRPAKLRDEILRHVLHWSRNCYVEFVTRGTLDGDEATNGDIWARTLIK